RLQKKEATKVCPSMSRRKSSPQIIQIRISGHAADSGTTQKRWISHVRIKPASVDDYFRKLKRPIKCQLTIESPLDLTPERRQVAGVEMHRYSDGRIVPGRTFVSSRA